jgi:hypothetical protein
MPAVLPVGKPVPVTTTCIGFEDDTSIVVTVAMGALKANLQLPGAKQVASLEAASVTTTSLSSFTYSTDKPVLRMRQVIYVVVTVIMSQ